MNSGLVRFIGLVLLAVLAGSGATAPALAQDESWHVIQANFDKYFVPLPLDRMFGDPDRELMLSRRAPYTSAKRDEIEKDRAALRLRRAQIMDERANREGVVASAGAHEGPRAAGLLMEMYELQLLEVARARKQRDSLDEAGQVDINPGVDPGGVYWERWLNKERSSARAMVAAEEKIRDLALEQCARRMTPEIRTWMIRQADKSDSPEVRGQMISVLAATKDPVDAVALGDILESEREVWARVKILDAFGRAKTAGSGPFILSALTDKAWPVRSAAVSAVRALGLRDAAAVDALIAGMEASDGRVRHEMRVALSEATGRPFGLDPAEWRLWWGQNREEWAAPEKGAEVAPLDVPLPRVFGRPTASKRIAVLICRGSIMTRPVKRRLTNDAGEPSPAPAVDTALNVACWELGEALSALPPDAEFIVVLYDGEPHFSGKKLRRATKDNRNKTLAFVSRFEPEGGSNWYAALMATLRLGVPRKTTDLALAGVGDVDTIFLIGGGPKRSNEVFMKIRRLRRVVMHSVDLSRIAKDANAPK